VVRVIQTISVCHKYNAHFNDHHHTIM